MHFPHRDPALARYGFQDKSTIRLSPRLIQRHYAADQMSVQMEWAVGGVDKPFMAQQVDAGVSTTEFIAVLSRFCRLTAGYRRHSDRRATCRFQVEHGKVPVVIGSGAAASRGALLTISSAGGQMVVDRAIASGTEVELVLTVGAESYRHPARVLRCHAEQDRCVLVARFAPGHFERCPYPR